MTSSRGPTVVHGCKKCGHASRLHVTVYIYCGYTVNNNIIVITVSVSVSSSATAQLSLSPVTGVQCYGDPVTLVCTHPVLPQKPEFIHADVTWMRDGTAISTVGLGRTNLNTTTTRLQFTITEDTIGNYTCFLSNNVRGGIVESNSVSVQPRGECTLTVT